MVFESADSCRPSEFPQQQESKFLKTEVDFYCLSKHWNW